jgi:short/branched chain acyl-CoA dehydrogenase
MGIQIAKKEQKLGIRASSTCTLNFDDLRIPEENVIGGIGRGYKVAIEILNEGRIGIAGQMLGLAQGAFDKAVPYTYERKQFGQPIGHFQGMQFQIAEAAIEIEAARLLTYNAARRKEEGKDFTKEAAMAKFYSSQVAQKVSGSAIEWAGGVGFTRETGIEKFWRDSKIVSHLVIPSAALLTIPVHQRAPFMKAHRIFSCKLSRRSFRKNTPSALSSSFVTPRE